jgi:hypothetical protein
MFKCPRCGRTSHSPEDLRARYCGGCHTFFGGPTPAQPIIKWGKFIPEEEHKKVIDRLAQLDTLATRIQQRLDGKEWQVTMLDDIAELLREAGYPVQDLVAPIPPLLHMPVITAAKLRERNACIDQIVLFRRLFGDEVEVTVDRAVSHAECFDFEWAADNLLFEDDAAEVELLANANEDEGYNQAIARAFAEVYIRVFPKVP